MAEEKHTYPPQNPPPYSPEIVDSTAPQQPAVVVQRTTVPIIVTNSMGLKSTKVTCVSCREQISTRVQRSPSTRTHLFALLLCFVCFPFACVPYCVDTCNNAEHYCPNCNAYIGTYNGM